MTKSKNPREEKENIIIMATALKFQYGTNDPLIIAQKMGIELGWCEIDDGNSYYGEKSGRKEININKKYKDDYEKQVYVCAHELGHIYLGHKGRNYYKDPNIDLDYAANLFGLTLLYGSYFFNDDIINKDSYELHTFMEKKLGR